MASSHSHDRWFPDEIWLLILADYFETTTFVNRRCIVFEQPVNSAILRTCKRLSSLAMPLYLNRTQAFLTFDAEHPRCVDVDVSSPRLSRVHVVCRTDKDDVGLKNFAAYLREKDVGSSQWRVCSLATIGDYSVFPRLYLTLAKHMPFAHIEEIRELQFKGLITFAAQRLHLDGLNHLGIYYVSTNPWKRWIMWLPTTKNSRMGCVLFDARHAESGRKKAWYWKVQFNPGYKLYNPECRHAQQEWKQWQEKHDRSLSHCGKVKARDEGSQPFKLITNSDLFEQGCESLPCWRFLDEKKYGAILAYDPRCVPDSRIFVVHPDSFQLISSR